MTHPDKTRDILAQALEPFRKASIDEASERARLIVWQVRDELAKHGGKLDEAAPNRADIGSLHKRQLFLRLATRVDKAAALSSRTAVYHVDPEAERRFIDQAEHAAEANFQAYVDKMRGKVKVPEATAGPIKKAAAYSINLGSLWNGSTLTVWHDDGSSAEWRTKRIVNISVYGKLFNQWPTRRVK